MRNIKSAFNAQVEVSFLSTPRKKLIDSRKKLGFTQEELANKAKISRAYLANIEAGKYTPSLEVAKNLSSLLNMSIDDLFL
jgi:putative transcriptional regulator